MVQIIPLSSVSSDTVETLLDAAFGADRKARTAYRMRDGVAAIDALSFAALATDGQLLGSIQCWPLALEADDQSLHSMILVGPIAVLPTAQGLGIGQKLTHTSLAAADSGLADTLVMIGDPEYYGRFFGFSSAATGGWAAPGPVERHRLLARTIRARALPRTGRLIPDPAFATATLNA